MKKIKKPIKKKKTAKSANKKRKSQKGTKYRPNVSERKLLEVLLNPEYRFKNITEICDIAKVNRKSYYRAFEKEGFCKYVERETDRLIDKSYAAMINASIRQATRGDAAHLKIMLQMKGKLVERHIFPDKDGKPQNITTPQLSNNEILRRLDILYKTGLKRKIEAEKNAPGE